MGKHSVRQAGCEGTCDGLQCRGSEDATMLSTVRTAARGHPWVCAPARTELAIGGARICWLTAGAAAPTLLGGWTARWQQDLEAAVAWRRGDAEVAAVALHDDPPADVQSETGARADRLGGVERLEDAAADRFGDARAGVADLDQYAVAIAAGAQPQGAAGGRGVDGRGR